MVGGRLNWTASRMRDRLVVGVISHSSDVRMGSESASRRCPGLTPSCMHAGAASLHILQAMSPLGYPTYVSFATSITAVHVHVCTEEHALLSVLWQLLPRGLRSCADRQDVACIAPNVLLACGAPAAPPPQQCCTC